jgi:hypothetical protein
VRQPRVSGSICKGEVLIFHIAICALNNDLLPHVEHLTVTSDPEPGMAKGWKV